VKFAIVIISCFKRDHIWNRIFQEAGEKKKRFQIFQRVEDGGKRLQIFQKAEEKEGLL
jgi:hypothetical protein